MGIWKSVILERVMTRETKAMLVPEEPYPCAPGCDPLNCLFVVYLFFKS